MIAKIRSHHVLAALFVAIGVLLCACSPAVTLETPQGKLKVESLDYLHRDGTFNAGDRDRLVLTLTRADKKMFSVDGLNYIIQSGSYLTDNNGKVYTIPDSVRNAEILDSYTDKFRLEFSGKPGKDRVFTLHWPDNSPLEIEREKHFRLDG